MTTTTPTLPATRETLTTGAHYLTVTLAPTFVRARQLLGDAFHDSYRYKLERVNPRDGGSFLFLSVWTTSAKGDNGRFVYVGSVSTGDGVLSLTKRSAFPAHATRFRVADRVLRCLFAGEGAKIAAAGWTVEVTSVDAAEVVAPF